jgi:hypothetical protein
MIGRAGASPKEIRPSTPLAEYTRRHAGVFLGPISSLVPGALPPVAVTTPTYHAAVWASFAGLVLFGIGCATGIDRLAPVGAVLFVLGCSAVWVAARHVLPSAVEFGDLRTFGDLAATIARGGALQEQCPPGPDPGPTR